MTVKTKATSTTGEQYMLDLREMRLAKHFGVQTLSKLLVSLEEKIVDIHIHSDKDTHKMTHVEIRRLRQQSASTKQ